MEKVAYISVLFHREDLLPDLFASIDRQTLHPACIYLIDNAPSDAMRDMIRSIRQTYTWLPIVHAEQPENKGAAEANNIGIRLAQEAGCTACILSNTDVVYANPVLFETIVQRAANEQLDIIAPKVYYYQTNRLWYAGGDIIKWKGGVVHYFDTKEEAGLTIHSCFTGYAPTTFVYINMQVFQKAGLFNPQYFLYMEDAEWMYRARLQGYKIWFAADLSLEHKLSITTGGKLSAISLYYNTRNRFFFIRQYVRFLQRIVVGVYIIVSTFYFLASSKGKKSFRSFSRGVWDGMIQKLEPLQPPRP